MTMVNMFASTFVSTAGGDLMTQFRAACGNSGAMLRSLTLISDAELHVKFNGGNYSALYLDIDTKYKISIPPDTVLISSLITQEAGANVWMAAGY